MKHQFHIKTNNENEFNDIETEKTLLTFDQVFETRTNEGNGRSMGV
jgi:HKD family nuclease